MATILTAETENPLAMDELCVMTMHEVLRIVEQKDATDFENKSRKSTLELTSLTTSVCLRL